MNYRSDSASNQVACHDSSIESHKSQSEAKALKIDREAAIAQLTALGYVEGESLFIRCFPPKIKGTPSKAKNIDCKFPDLPWNKLEQLQHQGYGVYFVVNGGGHQDKDVADAKALFFEWDDIPISEQLTKWQELGLPEPTIQITTRKSVHNYYRLTDCDIDSWKQLQADLLAFTKSDLKLKNPSRVMRLAGCWHIKQGEQPIQCVLIHESETTLTFNQARLVVPTPEPSLIEEYALPMPSQLSEPESKPKSISDVLDDVYSRLDAKQLYNWSGHEWQESRDGKLRGCCPFHNSETGTAFWVEPSSDRRTFVWACPSCTNNQKSNVIAYRHQLKGGNGSPRGKDFIEITEELARQAGVEMPEFNQGEMRVVSPDEITQPTEKAQATSNVIAGKIKKATPSIDIHKSLQELAEQSLSSSKLKAELLELASASQKPYNAIKELYEAIIAERSEGTFDEEDLAKVKELLDIRQQRLVARGILHDSLAELIESHAKAMPTSEAWMLTTLFPALGSALGAGQRVVIKPSANYAQRPIIWSAIVSKSGKKKSPAQDAFVDPLSRLDDRDFIRFKAEATAYKKEVSRREKNKDYETEDLEKPKARQRWISNDATIEALFKILGDCNPEILYHVDELAGFFRGFNQYKTRGGSDEARWLNIFNGKGNKSDRVNADPLEQNIVEKSCVCITGTVQWSTLQRIQKDFGGFGDPAGLFARFLMCAEEAPPAYLDLSGDIDEKSPLPEYMELVYGALRDLPDSDYLLSKDAKALFQAWQHELTDRIEGETHEGLAASYSKGETYTGRLALILHCTNAVLSGRKPEPVVSGETMQRAIKLVSYYIRQMRLIYNVNDPEEVRNAIMLEIIAKAEKAGGTITASALKRDLWRFRKMPVPEINQHLCAMENQGLGTIESFEHRGQSAVRLVLNPQSAPQVDDFSRKHQPGTQEKVKTPTAQLFSQINENSPKPQPAKPVEQEQDEPPEPDEIDGFCKGDRVEITLDKVGEETRKQILKEDDCSDFGLRGTIIEFKRRGILGFAPVIKIDGKSKHSVYPTGFLRRIDDSSHQNHNPRNPDLPGWVEKGKEIRHTPSDKQFKLLAVRKIVKGKDVGGYRLMSSTGEKFPLAECEPMLAN